MNRNNALVAGIIVLVLALVIVVVVFATRKSTTAPSTVVVTNPSTTSTPTPTKGEYVFPGPIPAQTPGTPVVGTTPSSKTNNASSITRTDAVLNGEVIPNRNQTVYWFEYGTSSGLGSKTEYVSAGDGTARVNASIPISGLTPATTYYFRLDAQNQLGTVQGVIMNFKTAGPAAAKGPTVTTQNTTSLGTTSATVHGTVNPNGDTTNYWFEYGTQSAIGSILPNSTAPKSAGNGTRDTSIQMDITRLTTKTTYYYQIVAQNSFGLVRGDRMTFKTK
jgi:hypothetical protein